MFEILNIIKYRIFNYILNMSTIKYTDIFIINLMVIEIQLFAYTNMI